MEDFEDVEETLERLQREWLAGDNALPPEDQFTPSYCYDCARTSGVAVCRKPLPNKKKKRSRPAAKGISRQAITNHVKAKAAPQFKKVLTIQASAKIKKKALSNLYGQKNERGNAKSSRSKNRPKGAYTCDECGQVFSFSCNLRRHLEQHVQKANEYICRQCGESFTVKRAYVRHVQKHKAELISVTSDNVEEPDTINTPEYFPVEENDLSDNDNISDVEVSDNVDAWTYDMENTHSSEVADAQYSENSLNATTAAAANAFTSEEERPYACYKCGKTFSRNMYLNQHMRVHNNARPFSCQYCTRKFKTRHHSKNHEKSHMFSKPYPCQYCSMSFARNAYRAIHERRKHPHSVDMESSR